MTKMQKYLGFIVFLLGLTVNAGAEAKHIPVRAEDTYTGLSINVLDFGARGDGRTDDTGAIRAAVRAAHERRRIPQHPQFGYFVSFSEVYFPNGHYIISDTIDINSVRLRGENYAAIEQTNPDKDIFSDQQVWRQIIEGLTFLGGRVQLNLNNPNIDTGHVTVRDCHFKNSGDAAVRTKVCSTFVKIENCVFWDCEQAVISHADQTVIRDIWISSSAKMDNKAVIENRGAMMTIDNLCGVPRPTGVDQRWIDNYWHLYVYNCRFGGEGGGFTPVVNFAKFEPQAGGSTVTIDNSWISAESNFKRKCAVYCEEVPNKIEIRSSVIVGVPPIKVDRKLDLKNYFAGVRPGMLSFTTAKCVGERAGEIPELLAKPVLLPERGRVQLSAKDTKKAMERAIVATLARTWDPPAAMEWDGRRARTESGSFVDINPKSHRFDLDDYRDATGEKNGEWLAVGQAGDDIVIMARQKPSWPHVLIRNVKVDLDRYPYLSWRIKDAVDGTPNAHAVRIIDTETERMALIRENGHGLEYQAYNVKERMGLSGVRTFDIRFYFLGHKWIPATAAHPFGHSQSAKPGEYMVLDFIRFEAE